MPNKPVKIGFKKCGAAAALTVATCVPFRFMREGPWIQGMGSPSQKRELCLG